MNKTQLIRLLVTAKVLPDAVAKQLTTAQLMEIAKSNNLVAPSMDNVVLVKNNDLYIHEDDEKYVIVVPKTVPNITETKTKDKTYKYAVRFNNSSRFARGIELQDEYKLKLSIRRLVND